jgi:hypothetical protein
MDLLFLGGLTNNILILVIRFRLYLPSHGIGNGGIKLGERLDISEKYIKLATGWGPRQGVKDAREGGIIGWAILFFFTRLELEEQQPDQHGEVAAEEVNVWVLEKGICSGSLEKCNQLWLTDSSSSIFRSEMYMLTSAVTDDIALPHWQPCKQAALRGHEALKSVTGSDQSNSHQCEMQLTDILHRYSQSVEFLKEVRE